MGRGDMGRDNMGRDNMVWCVFVMGMKNDEN